MTICDNVMFPVKYILGHLIRIASVRLCHLIRITSVLMRCHNIDWKLIKWNLSQMIIRYRIIFQSLDWTGNSSGGGSEASQPVPWIWAWWFQSNSNLKSMPVRQWRLRLCGIQTPAKREYSTDATGWPESLVVAMCLKIVHVLNTPPALLRISVNLN